jgi:PmbA protein
MTEQALNHLDRVLSMARQAGADAADALISDGKAVSLSIRKGELEKLERAEAAELGLRVFCGKRAAMVSTSNLSDDSLRELAQRAVDMAKVMPEDPFVGLADPEQLMTGELPDCDLADPNDPSEDTLIADAKMAEAAALDIPGVSNTEGSDAAFSRSMIALAASNGFARSYATTHGSLSVSVLAGTMADGLERDYDMSVAVYYDDLEDAAKLGKAAGERAVKRLGARKVPSASVPVVFAPRVARSLLGHFIGAINGASIARGTSFLARAMDTPVFAPGITIMEDPLVRRGLRSRPCDAEGLQPQPRALIDNGILTSWLLDLRSARQLGLQPTGHAGRGICSAPSPSVTNLALMPGSTSPDDMIAGIKRGLYVTELIGMGVNGVTGDYSRGAAGFWIENGELTHPVSEVTIAGRLQDMFANLTPASDWQYRYGMDTPTVCIEGMALAGA